MRSSRQHRRGANAIEFGLIAPIMMSFLLGIIDYGWFFFQESMISNAIRDGVRLGAMQSQSEEELDTGGCAACVTTAVTATSSEFTRFDLDVNISYVAPAIREIAGTCGLVVETEIPFEPLVGFVPLPRVFPIRVASLASNVTNC